jgi:peptidoglycan/LPS O-acetylase OafA/YrhL
MPRGLSLYLNVLRLVAAVEVALYHLSWTRVGALDSNLLTQWGHEAVVVFFVLSGYVIRHAAANGDNTLANFATSRLSRIYSVVIPCLALTLVCDLIGRSLAPAIYTDVVAIDSAAGLIVRFMISLAMLNQTSGSVSFFSNVPYWSLCYEFWYYALFAVVFYTTGTRRMLLTALVAVAAGPKILLLLPIWLIGAAAYWIGLPQHWNKTQVACAFLQPLAVFAAYHHFDGSQLTVNLLGPELEAKLVFSSRFLSDTVLALSLGLHLIAAKRLDPLLWQVFHRAKPLINYAADRSFTLYLLHQPVMFLMLSISMWHFSGVVGWFIASGTIGIPMLLGGMIEPQRHALRAQLRKLLQRVEFKPALPA